MTLTQVEAPPPVDEHLLLRRLQDMYQQAKEIKGQMISEWKRNYRVTMNRAAPNVPNAPGTRANEIFPTVDARIGWMTDQEVLFTVTPAADPFSMYALVTDTQASQLEAIMNSVLRTEGWYAEITRMLWDAALYGSGFLKCTWDQGLERGMGQVALKATSPWCLYVDPYATSLDDAEYIVEVHTMSAAQIERRFPDTPHSLIDEVSLTGDVDRDHIPPSQIGNRQSARGVGALIPVDAGQGPTFWGAQGQAKRHNQGPQGVNVYECWFRENYEEEVTPGDPSMGSTETVIVDQWRVIVWSADRILLDELAENLFHANRHPYVRYVDVETGEFWGSPLLRDLAPCQQQLNTLLAMAQSNIIFTGNPILVGIKGSGADRSTIRNRPGEIFDVNGGPTGGQQNKPTWLNPPNLPAALMELAGFWREEIERIAGLSATQRGEVPSGRATDKQVQAGQEAGFVRVRSAQRNLELTLRKAGELLANLIIINYDTPRYMAIVGEEGEPISIKLAAQHFYSPTMDAKGKVTFSPLKFGLTVNAGSAKPTSRAARINEAINLKKLGVVDNLYVLQAFQVSHAQSVMQRQQAEQAKQMQMAQLAAAAKGGPGKKDTNPQRPG